jgi:hypothetical protein
MSLRSGEVIEPGLLASDDPQHGARKLAGGMAAVAAADNLHNIPEFHGLVWFVAQSPPHPVYAPPYWKIAEIAGRYDPDR